MSGRSILFIAICALAVVAGGLWLQPKSESKFSKQVRDTNEEEISNAGTKESSSTKGLIYQHNRALRKPDQTINGVKATSPHRLQCRFQDEQRKPFSGLRVHLIADEASSSAHFEGSPVADAATITSSSQMTNHEGLASFDVETGLSYLIVARRAGWQPVVETITIRDWELDSREFVVRRSPSIRGLVVDGETDTPIAGAQVVARPRGKGESWESEYLHGLTYALASSASTTDAKGRFSFSSLWDRQHDVHVTAHGYPEERVPTWLTSGQEMIIRLTRKGVVRGVVRNLDGEGLGGAEIHSASRGREPPSLGMVTANASGHFSLEDIPWGLNTIGARVKGYAVELKRVEVKEGMDQFLDFELAPEAELRGYVVDDRGQRVAGVEVAVHDEVNRVNLGVMSTEPDGSWFMHWAVDGHDLSIQTTKEGYAQTDMFGLTAPVTDLEVVIRRRGGLQGRVIDEEGNPVPKFSIQNVPSGFELYREYTIRVDMDLWHDFESKNGEFSMFDVWPSRNELRIEAPGFVPLTVRDVEVPPGEMADPLEITLQRGETIWGRLVQTNGEPVAGAKISLPNESFGGKVVQNKTHCLTVSDAQGGFQLRGIPPRGFSLLVDTPAHGTLFFDDLDPTEFPRDFVVSPTGRIVGQLEVPWSRPDTVCSVSATIPGTWVRAKVRPDMTGAFEIPSLAPGSYVIDFFDEWGAWEHQEHGYRSRLVHVESGKSVTVDFSTKSKGEVRGRLTNPRDPTVNYQARLFRKSNDEVVGETPLNRGAVFSFFGLSPDAYRVELSSGSRGDLLVLGQDAVVTDSRPRAEVEFTIPPDALTGQVLDMDDAPADVHVLLVNQDTTAVQCRTRVSASGDYALQTIPDGDYLVLVSGRGYADDYYEEVKIPYSEDASPLEHWMEPESRVTVTAVDDREVPIGGAQVDLILPDRPEILPRLSRMTDGLGHAGFTRLPSGRASIRCFKEGFVEPEEMTVTLVAGDTTPARVVLTRLGSLQVRVFDQEETAVPGVDVRVSSPVAEPSAGPWTETTDPRGTITIVDLVPGIYAVTVGEGVEEIVQVIPGEPTLLHYALADEPLSSR